MAPKLKKAPKGEKPKVTIRKDGRKVHTYSNGRTVVMPKAATPTRPAGKPTDVLASQTPGAAPMTRAAFEAAWKRNNAAERAKVAAVASGKPPVTGGAAPGVAKPPEAAEPAYGEYTDEINRMARMKYEPMQAVLETERRGLAAKNTDIDGVAEAYKASVADSLAFQRGSVDAAQKSASGAVAGATGAASAEAAQYAKSEQDRAQQAGTKTLADEVMAKATQAAGVAGGRAAAESSTILGAMGLGQQWETQRLGELQHTSMLKAKDKNTARAVDSLRETGRLKGEEGDFKAQTYAGLKAEDEKNAIALKIAGADDARLDKEVDARIADTKADNARQEQERKDRLKIEGIRAKLKRGEQATKKEMALLTLKEKQASRRSADKRAAASNSIAQFAAESGRISANASATSAAASARNSRKPPTDSSGRTRYIGNDGKEVYLSAADANKHKAKHREFNGAVAAVRAHRTKQSEQDMLKGLIKNRKLSPAVARAAIDFVNKNKNIGTAGYDALAAYFPGGLVPGGLWAYGPMKLKRHVRG